MIPELPSKDFLSEKSLQANFNSIEFLSDGNNEAFRFVFSDLKKTMFPRVRFDAPLDLIQSFVRTSKLVEFMFNMGNFEFMIYEFVEIRRKFKAYLDSNSNKIPRDFPLFILLSPFLLRINPDETNYSGEVKYTQNEIDELEKWRHNYLEAVVSNFSKISNNKRREFFLFLILSQQNLVVNFMPELVSTLRLNNSNTIGAMIDVLGKIAVAVPKADLAAVLVRVSSNFDFIMEALKRTPAARAVVEIEGKNNFGWSPEERFWHFESGGERVKCHPLYEISLILRAAEDGLSGLSLATIHAIYGV